jgi:3-dehydroquinate dehydratase-1
VVNSAQMPLLQSRSSILRRRPLVVGTLTGRRDVAGQIRRASSPLIDVVEIRLDTFREIFTPSARAFSVALVHRVGRLSAKPLLLTLRSHTERGSAAPARERLGDARREALLLPLLPAAALVDVEVRRRPFARRLTAVARRLGVGVIHSFHDFKSAPKPGVLDRWCAEARRGGADIFKAAVTPKDGKALAAFLAWGLRVEKMRCVLIGMGAAGAPSRTMGFSFGSILTFGHLGSPAAPGQMPAAELARAVRAIYGGKK